MKENDETVNINLGIKDTINIMEEYLGINISSFGYLWLVKYLNNIKNGQ